MNKSIKARNTLNNGIAVCQNRLFQCLPKLRTIIHSDRFRTVHDYFQLFAMFAWLIFLSYTRSYYVIYLLIGIISFWCKNSNHDDKRAIEIINDRMNLFLAVFFSAMVVAANYDISSSVIDSIKSSLSQSSQIDNLSNNMALFSAFFTFFYIPLIFIGGIYVWYYILRFITLRISSFEWRKYFYSYAPRFVFLTVFLLISVFYSAIMLLCYYPGISSGDSREQLEQVLSGQYTNHHPFYHTMIIRFFVSIGKNIFDSINIGVALYSLFSIVLLAAAFAYAVVTLYQLKINKAIVIGIGLFFTLFPINIIYSFTMWKDVPFAASTLIFTVSVFRYMEKIGKKQMLDLIASVIGGTGMCLLRSNGMFVFAIVFAVFLIWFSKNHRKMCICLLCVLCISFVMKHPVLKALDVAQPATVESLSIPLQQVSRTVVDNDDLTNEQKELISKVISIEKIRQIYDPNISDPIKFSIRDNGGQDYLTEHKMEYALLYLRLGITHPKSYFAAWIDETKGYWNGGYSYWRFTFTSSTDGVGTKRTVVSGKLQKAVYVYIKLFEYIDLFKPFLSIGLYTWLLLLTAYVGFRKRNKLTVFLTLPCIAIILSLLIATPVFAELRYAYALFCCLPFLAVVAFRRNTDIKTKENHR